MLLCVMHHINGAPTFLKKYRERREKIYKNRLKYEAARKRWRYSSKKLIKFYRGLNQAVEEGIPVGNTNHRTWVKKHIKQQKVKSNMHLHNAVSKVFKGNPEISDIFNNQANNLKPTIESLQQRKDKLKEKGEMNYEPIPTHRLKNRVTINELVEKQSKDRRIVLSTKKYLDKHDNFTNRCPILK